MKLNKIELEKKYKYKELCELFGEEKKTGKSKQLQIKDWERYINLEKVEKANFIIHKIYDTPLPKVDGRKTGNTGLNPNSHGNNNIYGNDVEIIIKNYINNLFDNNKVYPKRHLYIFESQLAERCGFITLNFKYAYKNKDATKKYFSQNGINYTVTNNVLFQYNNIRQTIINTTLKLQEKYSNNVSVKYGYILMQELDKEEKEKDLGIENRCATEEETIIIININKELLNKYEVERRADLFGKKLKEFDKEFIEKVQKQIDDVDRVFTGFQIIVKEKFEDINNVRFYINKVNKTYKNELVKNAIKRVEKLKKWKEEELERINQFNFTGSKLKEVELKQYQIDMLDDNYINDFKEVVSALLFDGNAEVLLEIKKLVDEEIENQKSAEWLIENGYIMDEEDIDVKY